MGIGVFRGVPADPAGGAGATRVVGLDALRALAALAVFVCHLAQYWSVDDLPLKLPELMAVGAQGVDLFIVLSGFVLGLPATRVDRRIDLPGFLGRRALRLLPSYYVALAVAAAIALSPAATWIVAERAGLDDLAWHVVLLQTWDPRRLGSINGSLWSVALEAQLYLVFPVLLLAARRWGVWPLVLATAAMSVATSLPGAASIAGSPLTDAHNLPARLVQFTVGVGCAALVSRGSRGSGGTTTRPAVLWWALAATGAVAMVVTTADIRVGQSVVWAVPAAIAVLLTAGSLGPRLARTPFERWGRASFSFYLLHQPVLLVAASALRPRIASDALALVVGLVVGLTLTGLSAWGLYRAVEAPSHRYGRRRFTMWEPEPAAGSSGPAPHRVEYAACGSGWPRAPSTPRGAGSRS